MKRFLIAFGAVLVLGLSVTAIITLVKAQRKVAAMSQFAAAGPSNLVREENLDREAGMLLSPEQMQARLPPASQNAAPLYTKLTLLLEQKPMGLPKYAEGMDAFHVYTPAQVATVRRTLAARQDVMTLVHQAADRPKCVFVRNWSLGADVQYPEYQPMREAVRLLKTESYLLARDGHYQEAITDQSRGFRVAEHAASDPVLLSYLVGIACDLVTMSGLQSVLEISGPDHAAAVQNAVIRQQARLSLRRAMAVEAGFGCSCVLKMHEAEGQGIMAALAAGGLPREPGKKNGRFLVEPQNLHGLIDAWEADYLVHMRSLVTASDLPPSKRRTAFAVAYRKLNQEEQDTSNPTHLVTLILMPGFSKVDLNETRVQTRQALVQAAAFVLGTKAKTGVPPDALPPRFTDPFISKPLGYRREGAKGFVVYSAGPDGAYDGGKTGERVPAQESVFRYPVTPIPLTADMLK